MIFGERKDLPSSAHPRLLRWAIFLASYDYTIQYSKHVEVADCLSRLSGATPPIESPLDLIYVLNVRLD